jgi:hypothetical protein
MRKYLAPLVFAGGAFAAAPLAAAPSVREAGAELNAATAAQEARVPPAGLRDEAAMVLVGTALIGLAAALRRAA